MRNQSTDIWENVAAARIPCRKLRTVCTHGMDFLASVASEGGALSKIAPRVYTWGAPFDNVETPTSLQQGERTSGASLHVGNLVPCVHAGRGFWQSPATNVCADGAYGTPRRFGHLPRYAPAGVAMSLSPFFDLRELSGCGECGASDPPPGALPERGSQGDEGGAPNHASPPHGFPDALPSGASHRTKFGA